MHTNDEGIFIDRGPGAVSERYELAVSRINGFQGELAYGGEGLREYFSRIRELTMLCDKIRHGAPRNASLNAQLFDELRPERYVHSYLDPDYCLAQIKSDQALSRLLCAWYAEFRGIIPFIHEDRLLDVTAILETTIQLYNIFEEADVVPEPVAGTAADTAGGCQKGPADAVKAVIASYLYYYAEEFISDYVYRDKCCTDSFAGRIVMNADLNDTGESSYLYTYGEWITDEELGTARLMASLPEETIERMAYACTDGYIRGFALTGKDISSKSTVVCCLPLGFERFLRAVTRQFREHGLSVIINRNPVHLVNRRLRGNIRPGFYGAYSRQCEYDHKEDMSLFWDVEMMERKLSVYEKACEAYGDKLRRLSGNACTEIFGIEADEPLSKASAPGYSEHQLALNREYTFRSHEISNRYIPDVETSFTIIAWPTPSIAARIFHETHNQTGSSADAAFMEAYREIFDEIVRINTLPTDRWQAMQQCIIDALDRAGAVEVRGRGTNETDITVRLHTLKDPASDTNFENCLSDVNIPAGEVFTSPVLRGTNGLLHVGYVYIGGCLFRDLKIRFVDGRVSDYSCGNFPEPEEGRRLIRKVIMGDRDALPLGEFAIGTNTVAYAAAKKYLIEDKLPVLIAEKTGPHFAVGDTCYVHEEDIETFNPDGKRITARENECSAMRNTDPEHAYFSVHCDITLPYEELGSLTAVIGADISDGIESEGMDGVRESTDGSGRIDIIRDGRFVLPGTQELNLALESIS